jgi:hypothetical protein
MEMNASLFDDWSAIIEKVHHHRFSPAHTAPKIDAAYGFGALSPDP